VRSSVSSVLDAKVGDLGESQSTGIGGHQQRAVLGVLQRFEEPGHLVGAEGNRNFLAALGQASWATTHSLPRVTV
jgi:hypothetical protein